MSRVSQVAGPGLAPPVLGDAHDHGDPPADARAYPFDAGPWDRFPPPLGAFTVNLAVVSRRAVLVVLIAWVPLLILSAMDGHALGDPPAAFLLDVPAYARYLVVLPLLIVAERITLPKLGEVAQQFATSGLLAPYERERFDALMATSRRLLSSPVTTIVILGLAYLLTVRLSDRVYPDGVSTWAAPITDGVRRMSPAGWWRALVSQPLYVALMGLWLWRSLVWSYFLLRVSRMDLRLVASHPDHLGGLQFAVWSTRAFPLVAIAIATAIAGNLAQRILFDGASIMQFKTVIGIVIGLVLLLFVAPLLALRLPLRRLRSQGILTYGELAADLGQRFEQRWLRPSGDVSDESMDSPNFSAVTDAYSIVANVSAIKLIPIDVKETGLLVLATLIPFVPLLLVMIPAAELLKFVVNLLL
jgi:hypothetical protein